MPTREHIRGCTACQRHHCTTPVVQTRGMSAASHHITPWPCQLQVSGHTLVLQKDRRHTNRVHKRNPLACRRLIKSDRFIWYQAVNSRKPLRHLYGRYDLTGLLERQDHRFALNEEPFYSIDFTALANTVPTPKGKKHRGCQSMGSPENERRSTVAGQQERDEIVTVCALRSN